MELKDMENGAILDYLNENLEEIEKHTDDLNTVALPDKAYGIREGILKAINYCVDGIKELKRRLD